MCGSKKPVRYMHKNLQAAKGCNV